MPWTKLPFEIRQIIIKAYLEDLFSDQAFEAYGKVVDAVSNATPSDLEVRKQEAADFALRMVDVKPSIIVQYEQLEGLPDVSYAFGHDDCLDLLQTLSSKLDEDMASLTATMNQLEGSEISDKLDQQAYKREEYHLRARQRRNKTLLDYIFHRKRIVNATLAKIIEKQTKKLGDFGRTPSQLLLVTGTSGPGNNVNHVQTVVQP